MYTNISHYCVRYDPYYCSCDPEVIWSLCQGEGLSQGYVHSRPAGVLDFLVPARSVSLVLLMDPGLQVVAERHLLV